MKDNTCDYVQSAKLGHFSDISNWIDFDGSHCLNHLFQLVYHFDSQLLFSVINENVLPSFSFLLNCLCRLPAMVHWPPHLLLLKQRIWIHFWLRYKNSHHDPIVIFVHHFTFFFHNPHNMLLIALSDWGSLATHKIIPFIIPFSISSGHSWNEWILSFFFFSPFF